MPLDREETLRQAEKLVRQGRLDAAIAEYVRLVEDQPRDWTSVNALGDLYLQTGNVERAVVQFVKIADHLYAEGFLPKAAALYKKTLKAQPDHDHTLMRLSEIAASQELLADARAYLRQLGQQRGERGDARGAVDCLVRLAQLPESDSETKLKAASAAKQIGEHDQAVALFRAAAEQLATAGLTVASLEALAQVALLEPSDVSVRRRVAAQYVAAGELDLAGRFLDAETAGADPDLLFALGVIALKRKDAEAARTHLTRFIALAPGRWADMLQMAGELGREGGQDEAFISIDVLADDAVLRSDWDQAIDVLHSFLTSGPYLPALEKLESVARDACREDVAAAAEEQLVDVYLERGQGPEARLVAERLFARAPDSPAHERRLRKALELEGVADSEAVVSRIRQRAAPVPLSVPDVSERAIELQDIPGPFVSNTPDLDNDAVDVAPLSFTLEVDEGPDDDAIVIPTSVAEAPYSVPSVAAAPSVTPPPVKAPPPREEPAPPAPPAEPVEIDLSDVLSALRGGSVPAPVPRNEAAPPAAAPPEADRPAEPSGDLESVFGAMRRPADYQSLADAAASYERGLQRIERGQIGEALPELERAAKVPLFRFGASARLGRLHLALGNLPAGIAWLERAAEAQPTSPEDGLSVLYELAAALERIGDRARALAVLLEIDTGHGDYRDVRRRIDALAQDGPRA